MSDGKDDRLFPHREQYLGRLGSRVSCLSLCPVANPHKRSPKPRISPKVNTRSGWKNSTDSRAFLARKMGKITDAKTTMAPILTRYGGNRIASQRGMMMPAGYSIRLATSAMISSCQLPVTIRRLRKWSYEREMMISLFLMR
jgi:hypothetical protein